MSDRTEKQAAHMRPATKSMRRKQLHEFQREIAEKTFRSGQNNAEPEVRKLGVQAGTDYLLMDLMQVSEVLPFLSCAQIPYTKTWFLGLLSHRDKFLGVSDLAGLLGKNISAHKKTDKVLTVATFLTPHCALRVEKIIGLVDVMKMKIQTYANHEFPWLTKYYLDEGGVIWKEIDLTRLVHDSAFLNVTL